MKIMIILSVLAISVHLCWSPKLYPTICWESVCFDCFLSVGKEERGLLKRYDETRRLCSVIHVIVICYARKFPKSFCWVLPLSGVKTKIWPSQADMNQAHWSLPDLTALDCLQLEFLNALKVHLGLTLLENAGFQQPEMAAWVCVRSQNGTGWHKVLRSY